MLLDTYVGRHAGERILQGRIRRGDIERIEAVIMLTDLRALSDQLPGHRVIGMLNSYFDCPVPPIERHGGEVLKFVGDGLLAIFPVTGAPAEACEAALRAVVAARAGMAHLDAVRQAQRLPPLPFGAALHLGEMLWGNIGAVDRLDFKVLTWEGRNVMRLTKLALVLGSVFALLAVSPAFADNNNSNNSKNPPATATGGKAGGPPPGQRGG
jgi:class 3 adenylate cyclase